MRRSDDGTVQLDTGRLGNVSERIVVTYEKDGQVVGRTVPHDHTIGDSLEERVLGARNTIFAQELWGELAREARSLAAYDVRPEDKRLTYSVSPGTNVIIELLPVDSCRARDDSLPENAVADTIQSSLSILLTYAHRCNELARIRPMPPHIPRSRGPQTHPLLRPIIGRMMSLRSVQACSEYIGGLTKVLQKASLQASFILRTPPYTAADQGSFGSNQVSSALTLLRNMLQPIDFVIDLTILPDLSFPIRGRTYLYPVTATYYNVIAPPESSLHRICAPYTDGYPDLRALADYLRTVTARALTDHIFAKITSTNKENTAWTLGVQETSLCNEESEKKAEICVSIADDGENVTALVVTSSSEDDGDAADSGHNSKEWKWSIESESNQTPPVFLKAVGEALEQDLS